MNEKKLIKAANDGDVSAMMTLADYYAEKSGSQNEDSVGDVISTEDFFNNLETKTKAKGNNNLKSLAYKYYRMAAEAGNARAMKEVGHRLYDGIGVEKNKPESDDWYLRAAEAGEPSAMRVVASNSYKNPAEYFKWHKLAAELLEPGLNKQDSIKITAINYACGQGTEKDIVKAKEWLAKIDDDDVRNYAKSRIYEITGESFWLEEAAESSIDAMIQLAETFAIKNDFVTALTWYKKAAAKGSPDAMSIIGDIYYIGEDGIEQSYSKAYRWYCQASNLDYTMAKIKKTLMEYRGLGTEKNLQRAFETFSELSWTRENLEKFFGPYRFNSVARYYAALMRENGEGCTKDLVDAFERYRVAGGLERIADHESARSIPKAIYKVADAYFLGNGVRQNFAKALTLYEKTITQGDGKTPYHREAIKKVFYMYKLGEGVPQDNAKAEEWRKKLGDDD